MTSVSIQAVVEKLKQGEVIAYPTEAVFGLGCDPLNEKAVMQLLALKQRPIEKGLILIAASIEQIQPFVQAAYLTEQVTQTWPGPVTWVLPVTDLTPSCVTGQFDSVAVRVSNHPAVKTLCEAFGGPIISTSANPSSQPPAVSCDQVSAYFGKDFLCLSAPLGDLAQPTQIWDAKTFQKIR